MSNQRPPIYDAGESYTGGLRLKRRIFLSSAAVATAACSRQGFQASSLRVLTEDESAILTAWVDALIPKDRDPGAADAGVVAFIDRQLTRRYKKLVPDYRAALKAINRYSQETHGAAFDAVPWDDRTTMLAHMEEGTAPKPIFPDGGKAAFEMVLAHTMQGFYGNPRHGGNRDYASWKMIGVPPMPVRGRQHYEQATTFPAPEKS